MDRAWEGVVAVAEAADRRALWREGAFAAAAVTGASVAFSGVLEGATLQVPAHHGVDRDGLHALATTPDLLALVAEWRDRPVPVLEPRALPSLLCAPVVVGDRFVGLLAAVAPASAAPALGALARQAAMTLRRLDAEDEAARREAETDNLVQSVPFPVVAVDGDGLLRQLNPPACELLGLSGSFDLGRPVAGRLGSDALEALLDGSDPRFEVDVELGTPPGTWRAHVGRLDSARVVVLQDVGAHDRSEQARRDLVAVMGHELRTPLTVVKGFAQTLASKDDTLDAEQRREFVASIVKQAGRLDQLVADLLFLSSEGEGGPFPPDPSPTDVARVAEALVREYAAQDPGRVRLMAPAPVEVHVDRQRFEHVVRHLVDNALKFSDGEVTVDVASASGEATVTVADHGEGIFSGDLERMFEPYVQLDSSSTRRHGGAGLGLYVARRLTELMGGRLECDSRLGVGSRFTVMLPLAPRATISAVEDDHVRAPGRVG